MPRLGNRDVRVQRSKIKDLIYHAPQHSQVAVVRALLRDDRRSSRDPGSAQGGRLPAGCGGAVERTDAL